MFIGHEELIKRIKSQKLLEGHLAESIQGSGVDLRIDVLYKLESGGRIGVKDRILPEISETNYILKPGHYYLFKTIETVNMPEDLVAFMFNRSSLFRCGASLRTAVIDPGYRGALTVGIKNESDHPIELEKGARLLQIVFAKVDGKTQSYDGRYQGGKVV